MKPATKFGRIAAKPKPINFDREERAAIHEFDGHLSRSEAEKRAAAECQHCGVVAELATVFKADYGYNLEVCTACAGELKAAGWTDAVVTESPV